MPTINEVEQLLNEFNRTRSEDAFRELVERYRSLVYSAALRQLNGDRQLAEDAMQKVFTDLAQKAATLKPDGSLGGWLHCHTCFVCSDLRRSEQRRRDRERVASEEALTRAADATWKEVETELDEAINELKEADRRVIVARFFEKQPLKVVGDMLQISDRAAHMRVSRAIERLRDRLGARGIAVPVATLAAGLVDCAKAAPTATVAKIAGTACAVPNSGIGPVIAQLPLTAKLSAVLGLAIFVLLVWPESHQPLPEAMRSPKNQSGERMHSSSGAPAIAQGRSQRTARSARPAGKSWAASNLHSFTVEFVDADTGKYLPDFRFRRYWIEDRIKRSGIVNADENGRWTMTRPKEHYEWFAVSSHTLGRVDRIEEWNITNGTTPPTNFVFLAQRSAKISGFVVDENGNPLQGKRIKAIFPKPAFGGQNDSDFSDSRGYWEINGLARDALTQYAFCAFSFNNHLCSSPAYLSNALTRSDFLSGEHVFVLGKGLSLKGQVVTEEGDSSSQVRIAKPQVMVSRHEVITKDYVFHASFGRGSRTDRNGRFDISPLALGRNLLTFYKKGYARLGLLVDVQSNSPPLEVFLERGRTVHVEVNDRDGNPVPGASVVSAEPPHQRQDWFYTTPAPAVVNGYPHLSGRVHDNGVTMLTNVPSVAVTLAAKKLGYATNTFVLSNNVHDVVVVLDKLE